MKLFVLVVYLVNISVTPHTASNYHTESFYADNYLAAYEACMARGRQLVTNKDTGNYAFTCQNQ